MFKPRSELVHTLISRGFLHQCSHIEALDELAARKTVTGYVGFDATADSLHVGHMVQIMLLRILQRTGHRPIALMGGGTTMIGDPSGKDESRRILSEEEIANNIAAISQCFSSYVDLSGAKGLMVNNADWLRNINMVEFLRDIGKHFSVNAMLRMDSVKSRLERKHPLSFLEFNYMVFQAYDFVKLNELHDCQLQLGGSDQWGNIVNGIELGRRVTKSPLFGWTAPLITTADGRKMGKTVDGAVWLSPKHLSSYDFWQFWRNTADHDVGRFLRLFTDLPLDEIDRLSALQGSELNFAKTVLANEATGLCRGIEEAVSAQETALVTFSKHGLGDNLPVIEFPAASMATGIPAYEFVRQTGLAESNSAARRLIRGKGVRLNDVTLDDENSLIKPEHFSPADKLKASLGKKRHFIIVLR